jgi:hypothetical protein
LFEAEVFEPAIVGDVIDQAAERVDLEHRLALGFRHNTHGCVERAAGSALVGV